MSLLDEIYDYNQKSPDSGVGRDEYGLVIWDNIDYYVARALTINAKERATAFTIQQYYVDRNRVFNDGKEVEETPQQAQYLSESRHRFDIAENKKFWRLLKEHLPRLDKDIIQISDNLFWDRNTGEVLENQEEALKSHRINNTIKKGEIDDGEENLA